MLIKLKNIIGIDIGGTNIRGILLDERRIVKKHEIKTPQSKARFEGGLKKLIVKLSYGRKILGIGIGSAGVIKNTTLLFSPNIHKIKDFDFKNLLRGKILQVMGFHPIRLRVDNDARAFARGEYILGAGRSFKNAFFLTIGTGIGRAYGKGGKILKIKKFEYPERWESKYQKIRDTKNDVGLVEFLGWHLAGLIKPYKPQAIIIGGGVIARKKFISKLEHEFVKNGLSAKILKPRLGRHSAALGAALLF